MTRRYGENRVVVLCGPWAFKFPRLRTWANFYFGCLNNINEARVSGRPGACPVLWAARSGLVSIMRRAEPLTLDEFNHDLNVFEFRGRTNLVVEHKVDSYGKLNGEIVAVDYCWPGTEVDW